MMKPSGTMPVDKSENWDAIKRLYRGASDLVRTLDKVVKGATSIQDLYNTKALNLRSRLRDACERLMFLDPSGHGKKAEDLLWRKVHYEVIAAAKNFRKNATWAASDQYWVSQHIKIGIGIYHHLLFRLQSECDISVDGCADLLLDCNARGSVKEKNSKSHGTSAKVVKDEETSLWGVQCFQRCLICMGDLARYHQELCNGNAQSAARYYHQALLVGSKSSMPHNQLGTLAGSKNYSCDAAYFYMRCVMSNNGFDGAKGNLRRVFDKNQVFLQDFTMQELRDATNLQELQIKKFLISFLQYCEACFVYSDVDNDMPIQYLCQMLIEDFQKCLDINLFSSNALGMPAAVCDGGACDTGKSAAGSEPPSLGANHACNEESPCHLQHNLIFKVFVMGLMCIEKLEKEGSANESAATALTLAAFSHLLYYILLSYKKILFSYVEVETFNTATVPSHDDIHLNDESLSDKPWVTSTQADGGLENSVAKPEPRNKAFKKKLRHRRKLPDNHGQDDSDFSDTELSSSSESAVDDHLASDVSDNDKSDSSRSDDDEGEGSRNVEAESQPSEKKSFLNGGDHPEADPKKNDCGDDADSLERSSCELPPAAEHLASNKIHENVSKFDFESLDQTLVEDLFSVDKLLAVVKVYSDWLRTNPQIISASAQGSQKLWSRYIELLNLLIKLKDKLVTDDFGPELLSKVKQSADEKWTQTWPLPEDIALKDFALLSYSNQELDFDPNSSVWLSGKEEMLLRIACLQHTGVLLAGYVELGVTRDAKSGLFFHNSNAPPLAEEGADQRENGREKGWSRHNREVKMQDRKKNLMHNMAQLWLEAEVKELETVVQKTAKPRFSPYLVPDSYVLIDHLHVIRQLMSSKIFIFILPIAVLQHLDEKKKESIKAREAIRWLEGEFQKRNRYLRAQKQHERLPLSLLKYPKRKDKEAWNMFAILECSNYFAHQGSAVNELSANLVTILTASTSAAVNGAPDKPNNNLHIVAKSAGLLAEPIEDLFSSWTAATRTPTKSARTFTAKSSAARSSPAKTSS